MTWWRGLAWTQAARDLRHDPWADAEQHLHDRYDVWTDGNGERWATEKPGYRVPGGRSGSFGDVRQCSAASRRTAR